MHSAAIRMPRYTIASRDYASRRHSSCHLRTHLKRMGSSASSTQAEPPQSDCESTQLTNFWEKLFETLEQPYSASPAVRQAAFDIARKIGAGTLLAISCKYHRI